MSSPLSVIMLDIDNFKRVNDQYGHLIGDQVIIGVANILLESCRKTDIVCRYGGEEYLIILPNTRLADSHLLCERIRSAVEKSCLENGLSITISGGACEFKDHMTSEDLIKNADVCLYKAKSSGKNRFETA